MNFTCRKRKTTRVNNTVSRSDKDNPFSIFRARDCNIVDSSYIDLVMLWGLIRGFVIGTEIGSLWLIVLGNNSNPTNLTKSFYRRVWRPLLRR
jgi:hypothetical protein